MASRDMPPGRSKTGTLAAQRQHGRFDADRARAAVENVIHAIAQALAHMFRGGRRKLREAIRAGRGYGKLRSFDQRQRHRMRRHAHANCVQSRGYDRRE